MDEKSDTAYILQPKTRPPKKTGLERRLVLKQDLLIVPLLALIYFVTFLVSRRRHSLYRCPRGQHLLPKA